MAKLNNYTGTIPLADGLRPANGKDFPLMEAHDILVDASGTRLDEKLASMGEGGGTGGGSYVLELSGESGTLTDEQYNALVANAPNVNAIIDGIMCTYDGNDGSGYYFKSLSLVDTGEEDSAVFFSVYVTVSTDKTFSTVLQEPELATKDYVDNAVANAGGGSSSGGIQILKQTFTDYNSLLIFTNANATKINKIVVDSAFGPFTFGVVSTSGYGEGELCASDCTAEATSDGQPSVAYTSLYLPSVGNPLKISFINLHHTGTEIEYFADAPIEISAEDFTAYINSVIVYYYSE